MFSNMMFALEYCWKADKAAVIFGLVNSLFFAIQSTYQAIVFKVLIDALNEERSFYYIIGIILLLAVIYGINIISQPISSKLNTRIQMRLEKTTSRELLQKNAVRGFLSI